MDALVIASEEADARAAEAVDRHHAQLAGALALRVESQTAVVRARRALDEEVRSDLVGWCRTELMSHALAEEGTLYRAAAERPEGRLLAKAMDARVIPHAIRHATIFGALEALPSGNGLVLIASHDDPTPLLAQLEDRAPGTFRDRVPRARA